MHEMYGGFWFQFQSARWGERTSPVRATGLDLLTIGPVVVRRQANILFITKISDPRIPDREIQANFLSPVGRCVVTDNQLKVGEILLQKPGQRVGKILLSVVDRQAQADFGWQGIHLITAPRTLLDGQRNPFPAIDIAGSVVGIA